MIAVDASVIVAMLLEEPEAETFARLLLQGSGHISAVSIYEAETVILRRRDVTLASAVRGLIARFGVRIVAFDDDQARLASSAYARFGKGVHPARLNLADCAAYALAESMNAPLLYKGDDFAQTDVAAVVTPVNRFRARLRAFCLAKSLNAQGDSFNPRPRGCGRRPTVRDAHRCLEA